MGWQSRSGRGSEATADKGTHRRSNATGRQSHCEATASTYSAACGGAGARVLAARF
jgi:hypothetical protein